MPCLDHCWEPPLVDLSHCQIQIAIHFPFLRVHRDHTEMRHQPRDHSQRGEQAASKGTGNRCPVPKKAPEELCCCEPTCIEAHRVIILWALVNHKVMCIWMKKRKIFPTSFLSFFLTFRDAGILTNYGHHTSAELQLLHLNILKSHLAR